MQPVTAGTSGGRLVLGAVLLVLLVTGPGGVWCLRRHVGHSLCTFRPETGDPTDMDCDGKGHSIDIQHGDVPASVSRLSVVNCHEIAITQDALTTLKSPANVLIHNVNYLYMNGVGTYGTTPSQQGAVSVSLNNIGFARLGSGCALSHWDTIHVSIANVHTLRVFKAIASSSSESTVKLENITAGAFLKGAFATTLREVSLKNVTNEAVCSAGTFAGSIGRVSLNRVRLPSLLRGCFNASSTWKSLNVQDSELGDISKRGILGRIEDVSFQNTSLGWIKRKGIQLNVTILTINDSSIVGLSGYGLSVQANDAILIQNSNISKVRTNAFRGLVSAKANRSIKLARLSLSNASDAFLRASNVTSVVLEDIFVNVSCKCNLHEQMCLGSDHRRRSYFLTEDEQTLVDLALRNIRCVDGATTPYLLDYHCLHCQDGIVSVCNARDSDDAEVSEGIDSEAEGSDASNDAREREAIDSDAKASNAQTDTTVPAAASSSWMWLIGLPVCLLVGTGVAVLWVCRRLRPVPLQQQSPGADSPPSFHLQSAEMKESLLDA